MLAQSLTCMTAKVQTKDVTILADILRDDVNLAVWQRSLEGSVQHFARLLLDQGHQLAETLTIEAVQDESVPQAVVLPPLARQYLGGPPIDLQPLNVEPQSLQAGQVALLKGERWQGNEGRGLVHRSPPLVAGERRLLLTLDWLN
tara:strand:- start:127 stop:561 length:435 start_codon:yes stop_codon:yes gene_type:complete